MVMGYIAIESEYTRPSHWVENWDLEGWVIHSR